jgi:two-component system, OmpR family, response regulator MtrA
MKRILVAEDDAAIRKMEARILLAAGYTVDAVEGGDEALLAAEAHRPDLAVLDVMMPGLSGFELARRLRALPALSELPVVFVTARSDAASMNEGFKAGGSVYLTKPFSSQRLVELVGRLLSPP